MYISVSFETGLCSVCGFIKFNVALPFCKYKGGYARECGHFAFERKLGTIISRIVLLLDFNTTVAW